jgi:hypothetical protein
MPLVDDVMVDDGPSGDLNPGSGWRGALLALTHG